MAWLRHHLALIGGVLILLGAGGLVTGIVRGDSTSPLLPLGVVLAVVGILGVVFGLLMPLFERGMMPSGEVLAAAVAAGRLAPARILSASATGVRVNNSWEYLVDLVVAPTEHPAYRGPQYLRGPRTWRAPAGLITVVRVEADAPRVVMVKTQEETDQSQAVPITAEPWQ